MTDRKLTEKFWTKGLLPLVDAVREWLFPRMCLICGRRLSVREQAVCTGCLTNLPYTLYRGQSENSLIRLFYGQVDVERADAYFYYEAGSEVRHILFALKYNHRPDVGLYFGELMARELAPTGFFDGVDALVPVPLAAKRQRHRGYNQCEMLTEGMARTVHLPVWTDVVQRVVENPSQTHLNIQQRRKNVEGIFRCVNADRIKNCHLLMVDDVVTTGATLVSCIRAMQGVAGTRFSVAALAQAATAISVPGKIIPDFDV